MQTICKCHKNTMDGPLRDRPDFLLEISKISLHLKGKNSIIN